VHRESPVQFGCLFAILFQYSAPLYLRTLQRYTNPILLLLLLLVVVVVFPSRQNIHLRQTKMKQLNEIKIANDEKVFANADGRRKFQ